jgi:hypothetical protein
MTGNLSASRCAVGIQLKLLPPTAIAGDEQNVWNEDGFSEGGWRKLHNEELQ